MKERRDERAGAVSQDLYVSFAELRRHMDVAVAGSQLRSASGE